GQTDQARLGRAVVRLAEVAVDPTGRRGHDDPAVALFTEMRPCGSGHVVAAEQMHPQHGLPVLIGHLVEGPVPQDSGVVHYAVDPAEVIDSGPHDVPGTVGRGDAVVAGNRLATGGTDFGDHGVGHGRPRPRTIPGPTEAV